MLGVVGILLSFVVLVIITYKGLSSLYAAFIVTLIVIVFNGMPLAETLTKVYLPGVASFAGPFFLMMVFGAIMGKLYDKSGAASSIARWLVRIVMRDPSKMSMEKKTVLSVLIICVAGFLLAYGGINNVVLLLTLYPLAVAICKEADIPQRFAIGMAASGCNTFPYGLPFSPQMPNVAAMNALGTSSGVAPIPGFVAGVAEIVVICIAFTVLIKRARARGEVFSYGPNDTVLDENAVLPNPIVSLIPLVAIFVLFNILDVNISVACGVGALLSAIIFYKYLGSKVSSVIKNMNDGAVAACSSLLLIASVVGFGTVVSATEGYQTILNGLLGLNISPMVKLIICILVFAAIAGSPTSAVSMTLPTLGPVFQSMGMSLGAVHRISVFAATVTDSLPCSGGVIMGISLSGRSMKEAYPGIFVSTVLATAVGTVVVTLLCAIPGLA